MGLTPGGGVPHRWAPGDSSPAHRGPARAVAVPHDRNREAHGGASGRPAGRSKMFPLVVAKTQLGGEGHVRLPAVWCDHRLLAARVSGLRDAVSEAIVRNVTRDSVTKVREVIERFYERFGAGDLVNAFACFAPIASPLVSQAR